MKHKTYAKQTESLKYLHIVQMSGMFKAKKC